MKLLLLNILFILPLIIHGQPEAEKEWTLQECIQLALENNLNIKRSMHNVTSAKITYKQSVASFLPTANVSGGYGQNYGRAINPVTNTYINRNSNTLNTGGRGSLTLFNGLRTVNTYRQSAYEVKKADYDLQKSRNDVIINIITLYTSVIFNQELYANVNWQLLSSREQLDRIRAMVEVGAMAKNNELTQEATVSTSEVNLINQENALNMSLLQLKQAMQIPANSQLKIKRPEIVEETMTIELLSPVELYQNAYQSMPEIQSALLRIKSTHSGWLAARGDLLPQLTLNANVQSNYSSISNRPIQSISGRKLGDQVIGEVNGQKVYGYEPIYTTISENYNQTDQLKDNLFKSFSVNLSIPIFNRFQKQGSVERAYINQKMAEIAMSETENTLRQTIETAYNDALAASKSYTASIKQLKAREEAYRMDKEKFDLGSLSILELQLSENNLFQAKSDLTRAKYNLIFKKKILDFYQGKEIDY